jgi:mycothiol synthase
MLLKEGSKLGAMSEKRLIQRIIRRLKICWTGRIPEESTPTKKESLLEMVWPEKRLDEQILWTVPKDYSLRCFQPGDEPGFFGLMDRTGFPGWNEIEFEKYLLKLLPDGFFFILHRESGEMAATAMALHNPTPLHPFGASLSCVAADPAHQGKGLGYAISAAVTQRILRGGYREIYLETHDWRLPAIKTYLKLGWVPFLYREDMYSRWEAVCSQLQWRFTPEEWRKI